MRSGLPGRVIATRGRDCLVDVGEVDPWRCVSAGLVAVVGDRVEVSPSAGGGGRLVVVHPRTGVLRRFDPRGREEVLASHVGGLWIAVAARDPAFWAGTVDRFLVGAASDGLVATVVLNKVDLGVPDDVEAELASREAVGVRVHRVSVKTGEGMATLVEAAGQADGAVAVVGPSGAGKSSIISALRPGEEELKTAPISRAWGTGRHTTTGTTTFALPGGGEMLDAPGVRTFNPHIADPESLRRHFPGLSDLDCPWRDCLHRPGEQGCAAEHADPRLVASYRRLLDDVQRVAKRARGW